MSVELSATNTPTPTATPTAAATNLTVSAATGTYGGTSTTFTATLTSGGNPVVGKTITFTLNGNSAGSGVTNASGVATSGTVTLCGSSYNVSGSPYATGAAASWAGDVSFAGTSGTNSLTVAKANATFTVTPYTVTYDGQSHTATVSTITGVCDETGATVGTVHLPAGHVNAGTYNGQFETWTFTGGPNYNDIAATQLTDVINKKDATWTTNAKSKTYGDNDPNPVTTGSGSGFLAGDNVTATYSRATGETVTGGPYHITATLSPSGVLSNYNITNAGADFAINAKNATWTTNPNSKTYGDTDPNPLTTGSGSGFLAGDNVTATYGRVAGETVAGGPYHITATLSPSGVLSNYNITNNGADFTINAKNATWTTEPNSKTYGDDDPTPLTIGSGTGFLAADNVTATYSRAAGETVAGGPYHITTTLSPAGVLTNYNITNNGANFSINPKTATWTTNPNSKTYGDNDPNPLTTGSGSGFLAADNVTATYSRAAGETVAGGPYHITATLSPAGVLSNYTITNTGAGFSINKANATVVVTPYSVTYDGNPHTATYTINGVNGESGNTVGTIDVGGTTHTNAGTYNNDPWTFTGGPDYNDTSGTVNDAIAKADATINVTPYHVTYDANPHTATGTATGVGGVDLSASLTLTGTTHTTAGDYPGDAWSFAGGTNYNDASGTVHDIIDKANATINVTPYHVTYDANPHTGTGTATGVGGVHLSASLTLTGTTHTTAGDYPSDAWSFAGGTNYNDASGTVHDIIDKANAMVTVTGFSGVYDGNPHGVVSSSAKGVNNEDLTGLSIAPTTYTNVPGGLIHWTFTNQNYADQAGDATVTITKAAATIVVNSYSVTYDGHPTYGHRLGHGRPRRKSDRAGSERYRPHQCGRLSERSMDVYRQHWQLQQ